MLENFSDFPRRKVAIYQEVVSYDADTGDLTREYEYVETLDAWVWQNSGTQQLISDKIIDQADLVAVSDKPVAADSLAIIDGEYYSVVAPDNVLGFDEVFVIGLKRTEKPEECEVDDDEG